MILIAVIEAIGIGERKLEAEEVEATKCALIKEVDTERTLVLQGPPQPDQLLALDKPQQPMRNNVRQ
jgi:hypothetical protein